MKLTKLLENIEYTVVNDVPIDIEILSLAADSRKISKDCLFFCIKGQRFDPHGIIKELIKAGAAAVVIDNDVDISGVSVPVIRVLNVRTALSHAAVRFYSHPDRVMRLIGVTGTNGKTSTTYFIESLLREAGKRTGVIGTVGVKAQDRDLNIKFTTATTPDTLELMDILTILSNENTDSVIMEVSSHAMELHKVDGLRFRVGVFTNLTQDHLDFHGTMENYFTAKARLFDQCEYGIINTDDPWGKKLACMCECKVLTYGTNPDCDLRAVNIRHTPEGVSYELKYIESYVNVAIPIPGSFTVYNSLAAIGTGFALNIAFNKITGGLSKVQSIPGRIQRIPNDRGLSVIIDYAHTPDGILEIIKSVREFTKNRVIIVFGCGGDRDKLKRPVMGEIAGRMSDYCVITSDNPRSENPMDIINEIEKGIIPTKCGYTKIEDRRKAIFTALEMANAGDSVIIAGKGHENYQELKDQTIHFDDAEVVREALKNDSVKRC